MVDRDLLRERLKLLAEYLLDLDELQPLSFNEFVENKLTRRYVERTLHLAIECCLDMANHIISDMQLREPEDNKDVFTVLAENQIIPAAHLDNLKKMAQFRNVIVHHYVKIDSEIVYHALKNNMVDIRSYALCIKKLLT